MAQTMQLSIRIDADGRASQAEINRVRRELDRISPSADQATRSTQGLTSSLKALGPIASAIAGSMLARSFIETATEADRMRATLVTMTGSVENANASWEALNAFARQTPYDLQQSVDGFAKLVALGLDPSIESMRSYGNTASAMGKDLMQMVEAVADATTGEFERLKEFGIKASQEGDRVSLTFRGVTTEIGKNADEIQEYLLAIGNTDFAGGMDRQMDTIGGAISNLKMEVDAFYLAIGDAGLTDALQAGFEELGAAIAQVSDYISTSTVPDELVAWAAAFDDVSRGAGDALDFLQQIPNPMREMYDLIPGIEGQATAWEQVTHNLGFVANALLDLPDNIRKLTYIAAAEIAAIQDYWSAGWGVVTAVTAATWETIRATVGSALGAIQSAVASAVAWIAERLASLTGSMADFAAKVADLPIPGDFAAGLSSGLDSLKAKFEGAAAGAEASKTQIAAGTEALKANEAAAWDRVDAAGAEVAAAGERRQAGLELALQMGEELDLERELEKQLNQAIRDEAALEKSSADVRVERDKGTEAAEKSAAATTKGGKAAKGAAKGMKVLEDAGAKARKELERQASGVDSLIKEYLPLRAASDEFAESVQTAAAALQLGTLTADEYAIILGGLELKLAETSAEAVRSSDEMVDAWETGLESFGATFEDTFKDAIRNGKLSLDSFSDWAKDWLANLAWSFAQQTIGINISGTASGGMQGGLTGNPETSIFGGGGTGGLGSIGQMFGGNSIGQGVASTFQGMGNLAGNVFGDGFGEGFFSVMGGAAGSVPNWAFGAGGIGGSLLGNMLFDGDYVGISSSIGSAVGSAMGPGIAAALGLALGPAGAIIGGLLGGAGGGFLGSLFGGSEPKPPSMSMQATDGRIYPANMKGDADFHQVYLEFDRINQELDQMASNLGLTSDQLDQLDSSWGPMRIAEGGEAFAEDLQTNVNGLISDMINLAINSSVDGLDGAYAELANRIRDAAQGDIDAFTQGMMQLDAVLAQTGETLSVIMDSMTIGLQESSSVANAWMQQTGSLDGLTQSMGAYYQTFFTEEERRQHVIAQANATLDQGFSALGIAVPKSKDEFRGLVESLDLSTSGGAEMFASLMRLVPAFDQASQAMNAAGLSAQQLREQQSLEAEIMRTQGDLIGATALDRQIEAEALSETSPHLLELTQQLWAAQDAAQARAEAEQAQAEARAAAERAQAEAEAEANRIASERTGLEQRLLQLQGDTIALRQREYDAIDESNQEILERIWALEDAAEAEAKAAEIANERAGLQMQEWQLLGDTASIREVELAALDASNHALQERIWALEDAAEAEAERAQAEADAAALMESIEAERLALELQLLQAQGQTDELRRRALADLQSDEARALQMQLYLIEDINTTMQAVQASAQAAIEAINEVLQADIETADEAYQARVEAAQEAGEAEIEAINRAHEQRLETLQAELESAQELATTYRSLQQSLKGSLDQILGVADPLAMRFEDAMAALMRGDLGNPDALAEAAQVAAQIDSATYTSAVDYERDLIQAAQAIAALESQTGGIATEAEKEAERVAERIEIEAQQHEEQIEKAQERQAALLEQMELDHQALIEQLQADAQAQIDAIQAQVDAAQLQVDAINGVDQSVKSVEYSLNALYGLMSGGQTPQTQGTTVVTTETPSMITAMDEQRANTAELLEEIRMLRTELDQRNVRAETHRETMVDIIQDWDGLGMPETRGVSA